MIKNLIDNYYKLFGLGIFLLFFIYKLQNIQNIAFLYGDDSWVVIGSNYSNLLDRLLCCSVSYPGISLLHQLLFQIAESTTSYLFIIFFIACGLLLLISLSENNGLEPHFKLMFLTVLYSSPMLINYSIRSKPYIFDAVMTFYIFIILNKTIKNRKFESKYLFLFSLFVFLSLVTIIPITAFFTILIKRNMISLRKDKFEVLFIFFSTSLSIIYGFLKRSSELENYWTAYYAPSEGGFVLFIRWLNYSLIRILSESNRLDLGSASFSILISTILIFFGIVLLLKSQQERYKLEFISLIFIINLALSILKVFPFGGSRANIYYMSLVLYLIVNGLKFIYSKFKFNDLIIFIFIAVIGFYAFRLPVSYFQTTRFFDQIESEKVIKFLNTSDENIVLYHGGIWTIGTYLDVPIKMENKGLNFSGSGVSNVPIPEFEKENLFIPCTRHKIQGHCKDKIKIFLNSKDSKVYYLAALHIRVDQYQEYLDTFEEFGFKNSVVISGSEVELVKFEK